MFDSLFVTWTGSHIEIKFADELIGANFDISRVPPEVTPKPYSEGKGQDYDFTQENVAAQADARADMADGAEDQRQKLVVSGAIRIMRSQHCAAN